MQEINRLSFDYFFRIHAIRITIIKQQYERPYKSKYIDDKYKNFQLLYLPITN